MSGNTDRTGTGPHGEHRNEVSIQDASETQFSGAPVPVVAGRVRLTRECLCRFRGFEGDLPPEARTLADKSAHDLISFAPAGVREFEIGRRFERGNKGFPSDQRCALIFYEASGKTVTRIRQNMGAAGVQTLTYLGFPNGRVAARRLRRSDPAPVTRQDLSRCQSLLNSLR